MKIDVEHGDTWYTTGTAIFQYRGGEWRAIGEEPDDWNEGEPSAEIETPTDLAHAKLNAESLSHELVMPEEKGLAYAVNDSGCMMTYRSRRERDGCIPGTGFVACSPTGEVTP